MSSQPTHDGASPQVVPPVANETTPSGSTTTIAKAVFRRPARANTRTAQAPPVNADQAKPVALGFRTHNDAMSHEAFLFSTKTLPVVGCGHENAEAIVELVPMAAASPPSFMPRVQSVLDVNTPSSATSGGGMSQNSFTAVANESRLPLAWICRAYCGDERHAHHASGAISVHQRLMDIRFLSDHARGKALARVLPYAMAQRLYGLTFVELTLQDQFVSRSDMFLITEALRDRILYLGQEVIYEGFRLRVSDLLMKPTSAPPTATEGALPSGNGCRSDFEAMQSGLVTNDTKINFLSLSFVYTIMIELSMEMWNQTMDGRTVLHWAIERFLREHSEQFPRFRSVPVVRFIFFGRLRQDHSIKMPYAPLDTQPPDGRDVFHMVMVPQTTQDLQRLSEVAKMHLEVFVERIVQAIARRQSDGVGGPSTSSLHPREAFTPARYSNFLPALNLALGYYNQHHIDRRLDVTGQAITVISGGNGLYRTTNELAQITATKIFDIGIRRVLLVCMGRPPLHRTPLFEFTSDDTSLKSQYHLQMNPRARERFYEQPQWAECYFYHPILMGGPVGASYRFALQTKEAWDLEFPYLKDQRHHFHPGLLVPVLPPPLVVCRAAPLRPLCMRHFDSTDSVVRSHDPNLFVRDAEMNVGSVFSPQRIGTTPGARGYGVSSSYQKSLRLSLTSQFRMSRKSGGFNDRAGTSCPFVHARWYKHHRCHAMEVGCPAEEFTLIAGSNVLDADLLHGQLKLELHLDSIMMDGVHWKPTIATDKGLWATFLECFGSKVDDAEAVVAEWNSVPATAGGVLVGGANRLMNRAVKWSADRHFTPERTVCAPKIITLFTSAGNGCAFDFAEDLTFTYREDLFCTVDEECDAEAAVAAGPKVETEGASMPLAVTKHLRRQQSIDAGDGALDTHSVGSKLQFLQSWPPVDIGSIQIRSSILFAIQPMNPFKSLHDAHHLPADSVRSNMHVPVADADARRTLDVYVSAAQVQQLRWLNAHPSNQHGSAWATLCRVPILPIYGQKPVYSTESMRDGGRKTYWISLTRGMSSGPASLVPLYIKEYLLQRLHQQYQIVAVKHQGSTTPQLPTVVAAAVEDPRHTSTASNAMSSGTVEGGNVARVTTALGNCWSRRLQPHEEVEMTIGHQNQTLKIAEDGKGVYIQRSLHKGMYEVNTAHVFSYVYCLLNHGDLSFAPRQVALEAAIGQRVDFNWRTLDDYLSDRKGEIPSARLRDRQVCFVLLPAERPSSRRIKPRVAFESFKAFVTSRFSTKLTPCEGAQVEELWRLSTDPLCFVNDCTGMGRPKEDSMVGDDPSLKTGMLRSVPLEHHREETTESPDLLLRRPVDPSSGRTRHTEFIDDRVMGADIDISTYYHEACCYTMLLSWLCCAATIVKDWTQGLELNASKYGIRVVRVPCMYDVQACGNYLQSQSHVEPPLDVDDAAFRENALLRLANQYGYFPDVSSMNRCCRLVHASGLCFVVSLPTCRGLVWSENYVWKTGHPEQRALLDDFREAMAESLKALASI